jgi:adenylosuccinate synthase
MIQGATASALTNLDVLGYLDKIPVCTGYSINGIVTRDFPTTSKLKYAEPIYEYLDGWRCDISEARGYSDLPKKARAYVEFVEKQTECPIAYISNGPRRENIIIKGC